MECRPEYQSEEQPENPLNCRPPDPQGEYLPWLPRPVTLSTVTVGRKFSLPHLERALFLRLPAPGGRRRPVTCLTTAAKFDCSVFSVGDREATFDDPGSVRQ